MGFTKSELVQFFDELTGLINEENQSEANLLIRGFVLDLEKSYKYEDAALQKNVPYVPPFYIPVMPRTFQEEIRLKITEYAKWADEEIYRDFAKKLAVSRW